MLKGCHNYSKTRGTYYVGKKLIITEKPSVAQDYAKVFQVSGRQNGYIENDKYVITWCVGHLVEMVYPEEYDVKYKKWMLEDLPFLPQIQHPLLEYTIPLQATA